jgi:peptide-methionine (S)-S-oxide reductase
MAEKATFGAGCFWSADPVFRQVDGIVDTTAGFMGGHVANPSYEQVCDETTGHAEVIQVEYDPARVSYDALLEIFWGAHDPTQVNRWGPNPGSYYRSVIFFHSPEQRKLAEASKARHASSGRYRRPIATAIVPASAFWRAEEVHQHRLEKEGVIFCPLD